MIIHILRHLCLRVSMLLFVVDFSGKITETSCQLCYKKTERWQVIAKFKMFACFTYYKWFVCIQIFLVNHSWKMYEHTPDVLAI